MSGTVGGGKKYGLILAKKPEDKAKKKQLAPKAISAFEADEDEGVEADIARQAHQKKSQRELAEQHAQALAEDPSVFDYDGVYDEMQSTKAQAKAAQLGNRQSKYIGALMEKAKERERERDVIRERQLAKEREEEDHMYGDKERFVTAAYKRKLAEQAKWLAEEKKREEREAAEEVTKKEDMSDFYRNLLTSNVAFGAKVAAVPAKPPSASTAAPLGGSGKPGVRDVAVVANASEPAPRLDGPHWLARDESLRDGKHEGSEILVSSGPSLRIAVDEDGDGKGGGRESVSQMVEEESSVRRDIEHERRSESELAGEGKGTGMKGRQEGGKVQVDQGPQGLPAEGEKRKATDEGSKEDAVARARERYLARKKAKS